MRSSRSICSLSLVPRRARTVRTAIDAAATASRRRPRVFRATSRIAAAAWTQSLAVIGIRRVKTDDGASANGTVTATVIAIVTVVGEIATDMKTSEVGTAMTTATDVTGTAIVIEIETVIVTETAIVTGGTAIEGMTTRNSGVGADTTSAVTATTTTRPDTAAAAADTATAAADTGGTTIAAGAAAVEGPDSATTATGAAGSGRLVSKARWWLMEW